MKILFIHSFIDSQFLELHKYFNQTGLAQSTLLTFDSEKTRLKQVFIPNIRTFQADGDPHRAAYLFSGVAETAARRSVAIRHELQQYLKQEKFDIVVGHGSYGSPHLLFDDFKIPFITYIEFPSYRTLGMDPQYPWPEWVQIQDKSFEMLSYYQAQKSDAVIVPSLHAKRMFPANLQEKIVVQMEGFNPSQLRAAPATGPNDKPFSVGFAARALQSPKGFEQFIRVSKRVLEKTQDVRFVILGDARGAPYGFEWEEVLRTMGKGATFKDYVLKKHPIDERFYEFAGLLPYEAFSDRVNETDIFAYPLLVGAAPWGFYELFLRGKPVIASEKSFLPEIISHRKDAFIVPYDDIDGWVTQILELKENAELRKQIGLAAQKKGEEFYIGNVAPKYLEIFERTIRNKPSQSSPKSLD